tara:strand:- start:188 stop:577 length:390 start_codon:yes stop_codon:yes gene_type:complete
MTDTVTIPTDVAWGDAATAINHNTNEFNTALATKLTDADVKLQSEVASTTGDVTINKPMGRVSFVTGGTTLVVTNSLATVNSNVFCSVLAADTATIKNVIPAAGSFNIILTAGASAELQVAFMVVNPAT